MLHELLLALHGHAGSVFVRDEDARCIRVASDLPFVHPGEAALLARLCKLATLYANIDHFVRQGGSSLAATAPHDPSSPPQSFGLYVRAFCEGVDAAVLTPYRAALLGVERDLLADPHLTTAHVHRALDPFLLMLPALNTLIEDISSAATQQGGGSGGGCSVLEFIYRAAQSGLPGVHAALQSVLRRCEAVLYKQLGAWLLHGLLTDPFAEFFIQLDPTSSPTERKDDERAEAGVSDKQLRSLMRISDPHGNREDGFFLRADLVPSYIPLRAAEKILFIGESVHMFEARRDGRQTANEDSSILDADKIDEFSRLIRGLAARESFDAMAFEEAVDEIRAYVAERLWRVVVGGADLVAALRTMKDFYLLGRGELFLEFIDLAAGLLRAPPTRNTAHDVNLSLQRAARNVLFDDEALLRRFCLVMDAEGREGEEEVGGQRGEQQNAQGGAQRNVQRDKQTTDTNTQGAKMQAAVLKDGGWVCLRMTYAVDWPLHLLLTPRVLARYSDLFSFLLSVKRVQLELQQCWALQMHRRHAPDPAGGSGRRAPDSSGAGGSAGGKKAGAVDGKWWLRNHMAFLVDNLQYYLQVDVIESQFSVLLARIDATHDFEEIRRAHDNFLSSLTSQCFLHTRQVSVCLQEILQLCRSFCALLLSPGSMLDHQQQQQQQQRLDELSRSFQLQSGLLFSVLSASVRSQHARSPHLAQLLLRIDFNRYFTSSGGGGGLARVG